MARKMTEWPSKRGPITKIMPSDGCIGDTVPLAVGKWYDFHEFGWYMGNVGLSAFTFESLKAQDPGQLHDNLIDYITKFSGNVRDIFLDKFLFTEQLKRLNEGGILWQVSDRFTRIDLHPERVGNIEMGYLFEDLIRRFSEISNETAGEHFTPREVIRLIVELLIAHDDTNLTGKGIIRQPCLSMTPPAGPAACWR